MERAGRSLAFGALAIALAVIPLLFSVSCDGAFATPKVAALRVVSGVCLVACAMVGLDKLWASWPRAIALSSLAVLGTTAVAFAASLGGRYGAHRAIAMMLDLLPLFSVAAAVSLTRVEERIRLAAILQLSAGLVAAAGLAEHFGFGLVPSVPALGLPGSTFGHRNHAAEFVAMALPFGVSSAWRADTTLKRNLALGLVVLEALFIIAARTRGTWLALGGSLLVWAWFHRQRPTRAMVAGGIAFGVAAWLVLLAPQLMHDDRTRDAKRTESPTALLTGVVDPSSSTVRARLALWDRTIRMWRDQPLFGVGPGNWVIALGRYAEPNAVRDQLMGPNSLQYHGHSDLLERGAETGVFGFLALVALIGSIFRQVRRTAEKPPELQAAAASLAVLLLNGLVAFPLSLPGTVLVGAFCLGNVVPASTPVRTEPSSARWSHQLVLLLAVLACGAMGIDAWHLVRGSQLMADGTHELYSRTGTFDADSVLNTLEEAQRHLPSSFGIRLRRVQVLIRAERASEAERVARETLRLQPYGATVWNAIATACLIQHKYAEAEANANQALTLMADFPAALRVRAAARRARRDEEGARQDEERANELQPPPRQRPQ